MSTTALSITPPPTPRIERLAHYLKADAGNLVLRADLCDELLGAGQAEQALDLIRQAPDAAQGDPAWGYRLGVAQSRTGDLAAAQASLQALVQAGVSAPPVLFELARVLLQQDQQAPAADLLLRLVRQPGASLTYPHVDFQLLRLLHQQGRVDEAVAHGEKVLASSMSDSRMVAAMATLYIDQDRMDLAAHLLSAIPWQAQPDLAPEVRAEMQSAQGFVALQHEDLADAQKRFEDSLQHSPDFGRSWLGLGLAIASQGDIPAAQIALESATRHMPGHLGTWHTLAWLQLAREDLDGAERTFAHALALDDTFAESHGGMAIIAAMRGNAAKAREGIKVALRLDRQSLNALTAQLILQHGSLKSPELLRTGLALLAKRPGITLPKRLRNLL